MRFITSYFPPPKIRSLNFCAPKILIWDEIKYNEPKIFLKVALIIAFRMFCLYFRKMLILLSGKNHQRSLFAIFLLRHYGAIVSRSASWKNTCASHLRTPCWSETLSMRLAICTMLHFTHCIHIYSSLVVSHLYLYRLSCTFIDFLILMYGCLVNNLLYSIPAAIYLARNATLRFVYCESYDFWHLNSLKFREKLVQYSDTLLHVYPHETISSLMLVPKKCSRCK